MSDVGEVAYVIDAETGDTLKGFSKVSKANKEAQKDFEKTDKTVKKLNTSMTKLAKTISGMFAAGKIVKGIKDATVVSMQFEKSISGLSAITGLVGKDLKVLSDAAREFGAVTTLSATQVADGFSLIASARPDLLQNAEALKQVTREAITLAEAAGITVPEAAKALTTTLNQFGMEAEDSAMIINVLAAGAKEGASAIAETSLVLAKAGGVANAAGLSFEEVNGAIQALAKGTITGAEGGTALRNILAKLESDINTNFRPSVVGLDVALNNLADQGFDETTKATEKFGVENFVAVQQLIKFRDEAKRVTVAITGTSEATDQASKRTDNLDGDLKALNSSYEELQITIGKLTNEELRDFTQGVTGILLALTGNEQALKEWGGLIEGVGLAVQTTAVIIAGRFISSLIASTTALFAYIAASTKATVTTNAMGAVISRTTVVSNIAAAAMTRLGSAMALLGGPAGVVIVAAFALYKFLEATKEATPEVVDLDTEIKRLTGSFSDLNEVQRQNRIQTLSTEMSELRKKSAEATAELKRLRDSADGSFLKGAIIENSQQVRDLTNSVIEYESALNSAAAEQVALFNVGRPKDSSFTNPDTAKAKVSGPVIDEAKAKKEADELANKMIKEWEDTLAAAKSTSPAFSIGFDAETKQQDLQKAFDAELISLQEFEAQKLAIKAESEAAVMALQEERFRAESEGNALMLDSLDLLSSSAASAFSGMLTGTMTLNEAISALGNTILNSAVGALVEMGIQQVKNQMISKSASASAVVQAETTGALIASAYATPAFLAATATLGGAAATGEAAVIAGIAVSKTSAIAGRQTGGPVSGSDMYRMGENNIPEVLETSAGMFVAPGDSGKVFNQGQLDKIEGGSGGFTIIVNNNASGTEATADVDEQAKTVRIAINEISRQLQENEGPASRALKSGWDVQPRAT